MENAPLLLTFAKKHDLVVSSCIIFFCVAYTIRMNCHCPVKLFALVFSQTFCA